MELSNFSETEKIELASPTLIKRAQQVANTVCLAVACVSTAFLIYWLIDHSLHFYTLTDKTGTTVRNVLGNLFLSGAIILLLRRKRRYFPELMQILAGLALLVGTSSVFLPFESNWLLLLSSLGIMLLSLSFFFVDTKSKNWVYASQVSALGALVVGSIALSWYYFDTEKRMMPLRFTNTTSMSVITSYCIWGLAIASLLAQPRKGLMVLMTNNTSAGKTARYTLYSILLLPFLLGLILSLLDNFMHINLQNKAAVFTMLVMGPVTLVFYSFARLMEREEVVNLQKELQLYKALGKIEGLFLHVADAIVVLDENGKIQFANQQLLKLYGYNEDELKDKGGEVLIPPNQREAYFEFRQKYLRNPRQMMLGKYYDHRGLRKNGSVFPIEVTLSPIDYDGRLLVVAVIRDSTLHQQAQEFLRKELNLLKLTGHETQVANQADCPTQVGASVLEGVTRYFEWYFGHMLILNEHGGQFESSKIMYRSFDLTESDALKEQLARPFEIENEFAKRMLENGEILWEQGLDQRPHKPRYQLARTMAFKTGIFLPIKAFGKVVAILEFYSRESVDRTEEADRVLDYVATQFGKTFERQIEREQARRSLKAREETLARISHDLQNPLATILASADVLNVLGQRPESKQEYAQFVGLIKKSVGVMQTFIKDLLDFSKMQAGSFQVNRSEFCVEELVTEAYELVSLHATSKGIKVDIRGSIVEKHQFFGDKKLILRALLNLLNNAVKFSYPGGKVELGMEVTQKHLTFYVRDEGPGISMENQSKIFASYWQENNESSHGSGLGLAIAKGIAEAHDGNIIVESLPGEGSSFFIRLPMSQQS